MSTSLIPVVQIEPQHVNLIVVYNALDLRDRETAKLNFDPSKTLADYMQGLEDVDQWSVSINGESYSPDDWVLINPAPDDYITVVPIPYGGGGGSKNIMRMVALVAIAVVAPYAAAYMLGTTVAAMGIAGAALTGVITMAGGMLVNALLPPSVPSANNSVSQSESPTYGIDGSKNTQTEDTIIPLIYGSYRYAGNIVNLSTDNEGKTQIVKAMMVVSEGEIDGISDFQVNDQPFDNYEDVETDWRPGAANQTAYGWFQDTKRMVNKAITLSTEEWAQHTTEGEIDRFRLDYLWPQGLVSINDKGKRTVYQAEMKAQYRKAGTTAWIDLPQRIYTEAATSQPYRVSFESPKLAEGIYEIRTRRLNNKATEVNVSDTVQLADIVEIIDDRVPYNHTASFAIRVRLTDQLGSLPKMTAKIRGIKVAKYTYNGELITREWSNNPAWIAVDLLTNKRYGAGLVLSRIDWRAFNDWAQFCLDNELTFNGVFDTFSNAWDAAQVVLRVGHARFTTIGTTLSLAIYRASEPVMMFGNGNIIEGSLKLNWSSIEDRSNEFEIEFYDKELDNKQNTVRLINEDSIARGDMQRISTTRMVGIDNEKQAYNEALFQKAMNEGLVMSGQLEAPIEAMVCGVGDVVLVQHDMPQWGESGRIRPGSTAKIIKIDRTLEIGASPVNMSMMVHHSVVKRASPTVAIVNHNSGSVFIQGVPASVAATRLVFGDQDRRILSIRSANGYTEIQLADTDGLAVGTGFELWDTDVIEARQIASYDAETSQITLVSALGQVPADLSNYMIGVTDKAAKPFTVVGVSGDGDYSRVLKLIEYNETIFDPANFQPTPIYSRPVQTVQHVRDLTVIEDSIIKSASLISSLIVSWSLPEDGNYAGAKVYIARNGGEMEIHGIAGAGVTSYHLQAKFGEELVIRVVAYDGGGRTANYNTAPQVTYNVTGSLDVPANVTGFTARLDRDGVELNWIKLADPDVVGYEIREGEDWETGTLIVEDHAGTRFFTTLKENGVYSYWIKAIDLRGAMSRVATTASVRELITPPVPDGVSITVTAFTATIVIAAAPFGITWEVWRSNAPLLNGQILSNAVLAGTGDTVQIVGLDYDTTYYLYIRGRSAFGVSAWYPTQFQTSADPAEIMEFIAGQIDESALAQELAKEIEKISAPEGIVGSVNERLAGVRDDLADEAVRVDGLINEANESTNKVQQNLLDETVRLDGRVDGISLSIDATQLTLSQRDDELAQRLLEAETSIVDEARASKDRDSALTETVQGITATFEDNNAYLGELRRVEAERDAIQAIQFEALAVTAANRTASIRTEKQIRIDGDTAEASERSALEVRVNDNEGAIVTESLTRADELSVISSRIGELSAKLDAVPQFGSGFEPGTDLTQWQVPTTDTLTVQSVDIYQGTQSALLTSSSATPTPGTDGIGVTRALIPSGAAEAFEGYEIVVQIAAKQPADNPTAEFAIAFATNGVGSSTWRMFTPTPSWDVYQFTWQVPEGSTVGVNNIAIWADTSGSGKGLLVDGVTVRRANAEISEITAAITTEQEARVSADEALSTDIQATTARLGLAEAAILEEITARATAEEATTGQITAITTRVGDNETRIAEETQARTTQTDALATRTTAMETRMGEAEGAITSETETRATADEALGLQIEEIKAEMGGDTAAVVEERQARVTADSALAYQISSVSARVDDAAAQLLNEQRVQIEQASLDAVQFEAIEASRAGSTASIRTEQNIRLEDDLAEASRRESIETQVGDLESTITEEAVARSTADMTLADQISQVSSKVDQNQASVSEQIKTSITGNSLIRDGSFELGDLALWGGSAVSISNIRERRDSTSPLNQNAPARYFVELDDVNHDTTAYLHNQGMVPVTPGAQYTFDASYAVRGEGDISIEFSVRFFDQDGNQVSWPSIKRVNHAETVAWLKLGPVTLTAPADGVQAMIIIGRISGGSGSLLVTNIRGYRVDEALASKIDQVQASIGPNIATAMTAYETKIDANSSRSSLSTNLTSQYQSFVASQLTKYETTSTANLARSTLQTDVQAYTDNKFSAVQLTASATASGTSLVTNGLFANGSIEGWGDSTLVRILNKSDSASVIYKNCPTNYFAEFGDDQHDLDRYFVGEWKDCAAHEEFAGKFSCCRGSSSGGRLDIAIQWRDVDGVLFLGETMQTVTLTDEAAGSWQTSEVSSTISPGGAVRARVLITRKAGSFGKLYFTNVVMVRNDPALNAFYTAKVSSNGLIGGFGIYNNGLTVDAGFEVDKFWIGRTEGKVKPFVVMNGSVYMDDAMINTVTIGKLRSATGGVIISGGKIKAEFIDADNLVVKSAATFTGQGSLSKKNSLGYSEVTGTKPPTDADRTASNISYDTKRAGGRNIGDVLEDVAVTRNRTNYWIRPGETTINGNAIYTGDAYVDTLQIKGGAIIVPRQAFGVGQASASLSIGSGVFPGPMVTLICMASFTKLGDGDQRVIIEYRNREQLNEWIKLVTEWPDTYTISTIMGFRQIGNTGVHDVRARFTDSNSDGRVSLVFFLGQR